MGGLARRSLRILVVDDDPAHGLGVTTALIVKDRDAGTNARVTLEGALR